MAPYPRELSRADEIRAELRVRQKVQVDITRKHVADDVAFRALRARQRRSQVIDTVRIRGAVNRRIVKAMAASCRACSTEEAVRGERHLGIAKPHTSGGQHGAKGQHADQREVVTVSL